MNANAEVKRELFTGPVVEVAASLPFKFQINADMPYVTEPLATELYVPLANYVMVAIIQIISRQGSTEQREKLLGLLQEGQLVHGRIRDLPRSYTSQKSCHRWRMPDENTLVFDSGGHELRLTKFADDHFATFLNYGERELWIVRLCDDGEAYDFGVRK